MPPKAKTKAQGKAKPQAKKRAASDSGPKDVVEKKVESPRSSSPQKKRQRTAPLIPGLDVIMKILSDDRLELPAGNCREMLLSMAPRALGTPRDDRHQLQTIAVEILDDALQNIGEQVRTQTTRAKERSAAASDELVQLEAKVAKCQEALEGQMAAVVARQGAVDEAMSSLKDAEAKLLDAKNVQRQADVACAACQADKDACIELMEGSYKSLKDSKWGSDFAKQREQVEEVVSFMKSVKTVAVPSSLIFIEGPSVLRSKKESRGAHAEQIFEDIEAIFNKHLASIEHRLAADKERAAAALPTTNSAEEAAAKALQAKEDCANAFTATEACKVEMEKELKQQQHAVAAQREIVVAAAAATEKISNDHAEIEQAFTKCISAFGILRDQSPEAFSTLSDTPSPGRSNPPIPQEA